MGGGGLNRRLAELVVGAPRTELQRMVLEHDWAATSLGGEEQWSPTLRTAVATCLNVHSLDMPSDSSGTLAVRDSLGEEDHDLETAPERMALRPLVAALDDRDRKILVLRFVRGGWKAAKNRD